MNVAVNGRFLSQRVTGVQRHAREVVRALDRQLEQHSGAKDSFEVSLLAPPDSTLDLELRRIHMRRVGRLRGQLWEQLELPYHARGQLLINLGNTAPVLLSRQLVMIHDASVFAIPEAYSPLFRTWYRLLLPYLSSRVSRLLTNSEFSRRELMHWLGTSADRICLTPCGHDHILRTPPDPSVLTNHGLGARPYVLAVSSLSRHKNLELLSAAIPLLGAIDCDYVLAGPMNSRVFGRWSDGSRSRVVQLGYLTDAELRALYEGAACLAYPSRYEGFGIPPLEAMACGCPVIVSRAASLPEVCGDAALYVDVNDPRQLAEAIRRVLTEDGLAEQLRCLGRARAKQWTWSRAAGKTLDAIREVLA